MNRQCQVEYMCTCGHGSSLSETAWRCIGAPRHDECWHCGAQVRWRSADLAPLPAVAEAVSEAPLATFLVLLFIILLCAALWSGWLGRIVGAAGVILGANP